MATMLSRMRRTHASRQRVVKLASQDEDLAAYLAERAAAYEALLTLGGRSADEVRHEHRQHAERAGHRTVATR